jgi:hypothetical protein
MWKAVFFSVPGSAGPCLTTPRLLLSDNCKRLDRATVRSHVTAFRSDVTLPQRVMSATAENAQFFHM